MDKGLMMIFTKTLYKVAANARVYDFRSQVWPERVDSESSTAFALMGMNDADEYDEDPLLIEPEAFITYCPEDDTTDIVVGDTNYIQYRAIWTDSSGNEYSVKVGDLELFV